MSTAPAYNSLKSYFSRLHDLLSLRRTKKTKSRLVISAPFDFKKEDSMCMLPGVSGAELYMLREKAAASIVGSAITNPSGSPTTYDTFDAFDTVTLAPSSVHDLHLTSSTSNINIKNNGNNGGHPHYLNRSTSSFDRQSLRHKSSHNSVYGSLPRSMTAPQPMGMVPSKHATPPTPTYYHQHNCCRRCKSAKDISSLSSSMVSIPVSPSPARYVGGGVLFYPPIKLASNEPYAPSGLSFPSSSSSASSIASRD